MAKASALEADLLALEAEMAALGPEGAALEKVGGRQLTRLDTLTFSQRLIAQQMLMLVKNGHTHKFKYKIPFQTAWHIARKVAAKERKLYELRDFAQDMEALSEKAVGFIDDKGKEREFTWLTNLETDIKFEIFRYNFCWALSQTCLTHEGQKFALQLLDFVALESKEAKRLYRFLSALKNNNVTAHRLKALLPYFSVSRPMGGEEFLQTVIRPANKELERKSLFTFKQISATMVVKDNEDFVEIMFFSACDKHLPSDGFQHRKLPANTKKLLH
jgi:hypothetical protein